jgi:hypothetical protein
MELQLKQQDLDIKKQKLMVDTAAREDQLEIERQRIASQEKIAGMQVGAKTAKDKADLEAKMEMEGLKVGAEIARNKEQLKVQAMRDSKKKGE